MKTDTYKIVKVNKRKHEDIPTFSIKKGEHTPFFDIAHHNEVDEVYGEVFNGLHSHDFYIMIWLSKGSGKQIVDFEKYEIENNMIICLSPSHVHQYIDVQEFKGFAIIFSREFIELLDSRLSSFLLTEVFNSIGKPFIHKIDNVENILCIDYLYKLKEEFANNHHKDSFESIRCLFSLFCIQLGRELNLTDVVDSNAKEIYNRFLEILEDNYQTMHYAKEYASMLNVNIGILNKCCVTVAGIKAIEVINKRLATESSRMLKANANESMSIEQIAYYLGFSDSSNFSKFFRRYLGMSPKQFRAMDLDQIIKGKENKIC